MDVEIALGMTDGDGGGRGGGKVLAALEGLRWMRSQYYC